MNATVQPATLRRAATIRSSASGLVTPRVVRGPVSSSRFFEQRLRSLFGPETGFQVEESSLTRAFELAPRGEPPFAYVSCCVGEQRQLPYVPEVLLCSDATPADDTQVLLELGVFVFVASRI